MEDIQSLLKVFQEYFQEYFKKALGALWEFSSIVPRAFGILQEYLQSTLALFCGCTLSVPALDQVDDLPPASHKKS